jgi:hypothetical protein
MRKSLAFVLLCFVLMSCSSGSTPDINVAGTWATTFVNEARADTKTTLDLQLTQSGDALGGKASVEGENFGTVQGKKSGNVLTFTVTVDPSVGTGTFSVTTSSLSQNSFSGTYTASGGGFGTVSGTRSSTSALQGQSTLNLKTQLGSLLNR